MRSHAGRSGESKIGRRRVARLDAHGYAERLNPALERGLIARLDMPAGRPLFIQVGVVASSGRLNAVSESRPFGTARVEPEQVYRAELQRFVRKNRAGPIDQSDAVEVLLRLRKDIGHQKSPLFAARLALDNQSRNCPGVDPNHSIIGELVPKLTAHQLIA